jgi:hypothetical protein
LGSRGASCTTSAVEGEDERRHVCYLRKKLAVGEGALSSNALDALDSLKVGLLDGNVDRSTLSRLKVAAEGLTEETGDAGLDTVLHEIDLRVAVELAKASAA